MAVTIALLTAAVIILLSVLFDWIKKRTGAVPMGNTVKQSSAVLAVGIVCIVFSAGLAVLALFISAPIYGSLIMASFFIVGLIFIISYRNCVIRFDSKGFTAGNFLGVEKSYRYQDITGIKRGPTTVLFFEQNKIKLEQLACGKQEFLQAVEESLAETDGCHKLPEVKSKLFHGNIANPMQFIVIYVLIETLALGVTGAFFFGYPLPSPSNTAFYKITPEKFTAESQDLILYCKESKLPFYVSDYKAVIPQYQKLLNQIQQGDQPTVITDVKYDAAAEGTKKIEIYGLTVGQNPYLAFDRVYSQKLSVKMKYSLIFLGLSAMWAIYILVSVYVMNHAYKYSRRVIRWFIKPEYVLCSMKDD